MNSTMSAATGFVASFMVVAMASCRPATPAAARVQPSTALPTELVRVANPAERTYGPLAIAHAVAPTPWDARKRAMRHNEDSRIDAVGIRNDVAALLAVVDQYFVPRISAQRTAIDIVRRDAVLLQHLAPYSVGDIHSALTSLARIDMCPRPPHEMWHCYPDVAPTPVPAQIPYEIRSSPTGIAILTISDLSDATNPAWQRFPADAETLARAPGLVIDMRAAWGSDPRPLLPWLEVLTGQRPLAPLREIHRPPELTPYVAAYRARYLVQSRDPEVWRALVATARSPRPATRAQLPIAVIVGGHCESACELVARILETYAGATVVGGVRAGGRLGRDEPAMLTLRHSRIDIYFLATEYVLSRAIEAATGPTQQWRSPRDPVPFDGTSYALREVQMRVAAGGEWPPRCDSHPAYTREKDLPSQFRSKIHNPLWLNKQFCRPERQSIIIASELPHSAMSRFLATCPTPSVLWRRGPGQFSLGVPVNADAFRVLSRLAQSDVVQSIQVQCEIPPEPNEH